MNMFMRKILVLGLLSFATSTMPMQWLKDTGWSFLDNVKSGAAVVAGWFELNESEAAWLPDGAAASNKKLLGNASESSPAAEQVEPEGNNEQSSTSSSSSSSDNSETKSIFSSLLTSKKVMIPAIAGSLLGLYKAISYAIVPEVDWNNRALATIENVAKQKDKKPRNFQNIYNQLEGNLTLLSDENKNTLCAYVEECDYKGVLTYINGTCKNVLDDAKKQDQSKPNKIGAIATMLLSRLKSGYRADKAWVLHVWAKL